MVSKLLVVSALIFVGLAYLMYIPLPPSMAEPWTIRAVSVIFQTGFIAGFIGEKLGYGTSMNNTRSLLNWMIKRMSPRVGPDLVEREDTVFNGVPVRIYRPKHVAGNKVLPALVYYHGGSWVMMSIDSHDGTTAYYAAHAEIVVVSVEYRLAPEYQYPIPVEDCAKATEFLIKNADKLRVDPKRVAIGGDSAGGNIAAAVAIKMRDEKFQPMPKAQVLIYAMLQFFDLNLPSVVNRELYGKVMEPMAEHLFPMYLGISVEQAKAMGKNNHISHNLRKEYQKYLNIDLLPKDFIPPNYVPTNGSEGNETVSAAVADLVLSPYVSPLMVKDMRGLPQAFIFTVEYDFVRDDGVLYSKRLEEAGIKTKWVHYRDSFHGCTFITDGLLGTESGRRANDDIVDYLKNNL